MRVLGIIMIHQKQNKRKSIQSDETIGTQLTDFE